MERGCQINVGAGSQAHLEKIQNSVANENEKKKKAKKMKENYKVCCGSNTPVIKWQQTTAKTTERKQNKTKKANLQLQDVCE